jgi:hypothetical protein
MAILSTRTTSIQLSGDADLTYDDLQANNSNAPNYRQVINLASGVNTITPPSGIVVAAVTIIPPVGNVSTITFKGVGGDTGVALHKTDPSSIALDTTVATFVLQAGAAINSVVLIWS